MNKSNGNLLNWYADVNDPRKNKEQILFFKRNSSLFIWDLSRVQHANSTT